METVAGEMVLQSGGVLAECWVMAITDEGHRSSGIILHPTSLPGPFGIGDLGPRAIEWIEFLAKSRTKVWQTLPLGPTGYGDSPYQCFSSSAGNPYLISPIRLLEEGLLTGIEIADVPEFPPDRVDYGTVIPWKLDLLDIAHARFVSGDFPKLNRAFIAFRRRHHEWLHDFSLYMALKDRHKGQPWTEWDLGLRLREPGDVAEAFHLERAQVDRHAFRQFLFFRQWTRLREHAANRGVSIVGDIPFFVAADSADVWASRQFFELDGNGLPRLVAGVPPDYFSATGQLWGNPQYRWRVHAADRYAWWINRIRAMLGMVDAVRIDHFRAFADYWEIPADAPTAETGVWRDGPGVGFFNALQEALGDLPIIAEDLGELSPKVPALRDRLGIPGMKVLQFAFGGEEDDEFLPHTYKERTTVYTGTHDNDTTVGWWETATPEEREFAMRYLKWDGRDPAYTLINAAWESRAMLAVAPMQDFLRLGTEARTNVPGKMGGYWAWRMVQGDLSPDVAAAIRRLNRLHGR